MNQGDPTRLSSLQQLAGLFYLKVLSQKQRRATGSGVYGITEVELLEIAHVDIVEEAAKLEVGAQYHLVNSIGVSRPGNIVGSTNHATLAKYVGHVVFAQHKRIVTRGKMNMVVPTYYLRSEEHLHYHQVLADWVESRGIPRDAFYIDKDYQVHIQGPKVVHPPVFFVDEGEECAPPPGWRKA